MRKNLVLSKHSMGTLILQRDLRLPALTNTEANYKITSYSSILDYYSQSKDSSVLTFILLGVGLSFSRFLYFRLGANDTVLLGQKYSLCRLRSIPFRKASPQSEHANGLYGVCFSLKCELILVRARNEASQNRHDQGLGFSGGSIQFWISTPQFIVLPRPSSIGIATSTT